MSTVLLEFLALDSNFNGGMMSTVTILVPLCLILLLLIFPEGGINDSAVSNLYTQRHAAAHFLGFYYMHHGAASHMSSVKSSKAAKRNSINMPECE
jgi:hypothetical protein